MITIYVSIGTNYVMSPELFGPYSSLPRIREHFLRKTKDHTLIISDDIYQSCCCNRPIANNQCIVVSERMFKQYKKPTEHEWSIEAESVTIVEGLQTAISMAMKNRKDITILGSSNFLNELIMVRRLHERMFLFWVNGIFPGDMLFHYPLTEHFKLIDTDDWLRDGVNTYDTRCELYYYSRDAM